MGVVGPHFPWGSVKRAPARDKEQYRWTCVPETEWEWTRYW